MPIIGSSIIIGNFSSKGLTGFTGTTGPRGNHGPSGLTTGNTGATGSWISQVSSNLASDTITFTTSSGSNYTFTGFVGTTGSWSDTRGISAQIGNTAFSPFKQVSGISFEFYGLSAGINTTISLEGEQAVVRFTSSSGSYGLSGSTGYLPYIFGNTLAASKIYSNSNNVLNFGLTGIPANNPLIKPLFVDTSTVRKNINASVLQGITLDLSTGPIFSFTPNAGITAFINGSTLAGVRQEYYLIFNNGVKFLPKNLYFSNNQYTGIGNTDLGYGTSLVNIWSDNGGITFNAAILTRFSNKQPSISRWGSCCQDGNCTDNISENDCTGGFFMALTTCSQRVRDAQPGDPCKPISFTKSLTATGVCCCGITGCIDSTNAPFNNEIIIIDQGRQTDISPDEPIAKLAASRITVTKQWCDKIGGVFKPFASSCSVLDKYPGYFRDRVDNTAEGLMCPVGCFTPVTCCRFVHGGWVYTQETEHYCKELLGGTPILGKTVAEVTALGGCEKLFETGWCRRNGICTESTRGECDNPCGAFYLTKTDCETGALGDTPELFVETVNPIINVVHSIDPAKNETLVTYGSNRNPTDPLVFTIINAPINAQYFIGGQIRIKDEAVTPKVIDIWDSSTCFDIVITSGGRILGPTDYIGNNESFTIELRSTLSECITLFGGDVDFSADLVLYPISCIDGAKADSTQTIPFNYTKSPCSCLVTGAAGNGITGDIINKYPVTIPFSATRYCSHCTEKQMVADISDSGVSKALHIPYPLKTQTGFITFCPNTLDRTSGSNLCEFSTYWCIRYGEIKELSGCTYSSLFDANKNNLLFDDAETNVMPVANPPCYHAEYNEPGSGTTYWFSGDWDYIDINSPESKAKNNIRRCRSECRVKVPTSLCALYPDESPCGSMDKYTTCCRTCPGTPLFVSDQFAMAEDPTSCGTTPADGWICQDYQPYFNIVSLDKNVLNAVAKTYNINSYDLQRTLQDKLHNYAEVSATPGSNPVVIRQSNLFNPLLQNNQTTEGPVLGTSQLDPDELARASCNNCKDKFDKTAAIQVPYVDNVTFQNTVYDVYGIVIAKETTCTESGSYLSGKDGDNPCSNGPTTCTGLGQATPGGYGTCPNISTTLYEYKYYAVIIKDGNVCMNVFNLGSTNELYKELGDNAYLAGCGGGSILCDTDCGNGAQLKEVKWFGTLDTSSPSAFAFGFCNSSKKLNYNIKKDLSGYVKPGTGVVALDDIVSFNNVQTTGSVSNKLTNLGNMLKNIFGKERPQDYMNKICIPCSEADERTAKNCSVNIIPELIEFIGKDCYLSGFDTTAGSFTAENIVYDNTNNVNQITLFNGTTPKNVYWLIESDWVDSSNGNNPNRSAWLLRSPTSTRNLHNMWFADWKYFNSGDQTCALLRNWVDNRWLKNHNVSYLEVKNGGIVKRKTIYESPNKGITAYGLVWDGGSCSERGRVISPSNISGSGWNHEKLYLDSCGIQQTGVANAPSGCTAKLITKYIPKIDLNNFRPVTKIDYAKLFYYPDPTDTSKTLFNIYIKYLSGLKYSKYPRWGAMKLLYTDGTAIYDITSGFKQTFGTSDNNTPSFTWISVKFDANSQTEDEYFNRNTGSRGVYINHSLVQSVVLDTTIKVNINGVQKSVTDLLKSGNVYVLVRETFLGDDVEKILYSNYEEWERTGVVPKPVDGSSVKFLEGFNPYGGLGGETDMVLEDFGLTRLIPLSQEEPATPSDADNAFTGIDMNLRNKYIDGMCITIDCINTPDLCSDLGDC